MRRTPVCIRVDGKAFHTFTRQFDRPFDAILQGALVDAAILTASEMQGFKIGYHQSDEVTFILTDYDDLNTSAWFDNDQQKLTSVTASLMTGHFNSILTGELALIGKPAIDSIAFFDARAFNIPREEVAALLLWRAQDWERNSLQMYCRAFFKHVELIGKDRAAMHEMLHAIGKNWATDLEPKWKNGSFFYKLNNAMLVKDTVIADYPTIADIVNTLIIPIERAPNG